MQTENLVPEIAELIVSSVNLRHIQPANLTAETQLAQGGLGLDSIDILEVVVAVEHKYGVKVQDSTVGARYFRTIGSISEFILQQSQHPRN